MDLKGSLRVTLFSVILLFLMLAAVHAEERSPAPARMWEGKAGIAWSIELGSSGRDVFRGIAVDEQGNLYMIGNALYGIPGAQGDSDSGGFIAKITPKGSIAWVRQSTKYDGGHGIDVDRDGYIYIAGQAYLIDKATGHGVTRIYVDKLEPDGRITWSKQYRMSGVPSELKVSYEPGKTTGKQEEYIYIAYSDKNVHVAKLSSKGDMVWNSTLRFDDMDYERPPRISGLTIGIDGDPVIVGSVAGRLPGFTHAGRMDIFVAEFDRETGETRWAQQVGTKYNDYGEGVAIDRDGYIYAAGTVESSWDKNTNYTLGDEAIVLKLSPKGEILWEKHYTGNKKFAGDFVTGIAVGSSGAIYLATNFYLVSKTNNLTGLNVDMGEYKYPYHLSTVIKIDSRGEEKARYVVAMKCSVGALEDIAMDNNSEVYLVFGSKRQICDVPALDTAQIIVAKLVENTSGVEGSSGSTGTTLQSTTTMSTSPTTSRVQTTATRPATTSQSTGTISTQADTSTSTGINGKGEALSSLVSRLNNMKSNSPVKLGAIIAIVLLAAIIISVLIARK